MQGTPAKSQKTALFAAAGRWLQVSRYDRASSLLLALLVTIGFAAALLFVVWLNGRFAAPPLVAVSPELVDLAPGGDHGGNRRASGGSQVETPSTELVIGKDAETSDVRENLSTLDVTAASKAALEDLETLKDTQHGSQGISNGRYGGTGTGDGLGDHRGPPGQLTHSDPPKNWEVVFSKSTLDLYARQLDFFKIELGVLLPNNKIVYAYNLAKPKPDTRIVSNPAANERRYYLTWRNGEMQQADRELLVRAGVDVGDSLVLKFLPRAIEANLIALETSYAGGDAKRIRKTRFAVQADGAGYKFFVLEQSFKR